MLFDTCRVTVVQYLCQFLVSSVFCFSHPSRYAAAFHWGFNLDFTLSNYVVHFMCFIVCLIFYIFFLPVSLRYNLHAILLKKFTILLTYIMKWFS